MSTSLPDPANMPEDFWRVFQVIFKLMAIVVTMQYPMLPIVDVGLICYANLKKHCPKEQILWVPRLLLALTIATGYVFGTIKTEQSET